MAKARDDFTRLHEEERIHKRFWTAQHETCESDFPEKDMPEELHLATWTSALKAALVQAMQSAEARKTRYLRLEILENTVQELSTKVNALEASSLIVPIQTFTPEPFEILQEIKVVVRPSDDEFIASFFDANINASGCNESDAVANLKEMIVSRFEHLDSLPPEKLGPGPARQITVLRAFMRRRQ